ncbi:MAG: hypothetical protein LW875_11515 [Proteobacteria bacterium]|nr:hypothetical protein [Pseudomonadota bacterium]
MFSVHVVMQPGLSALFWDNHPFLYHLILKGWSSIFGYLELGTRSLSAIFSIFTVPIAGLLGFSFFGYRGLVIFGFLQSINPLSLQFAQEARMYSLLEVLSYGSFYFYHQLFLGSAKAKIPYFVSLLFLSWTHYISILIALFQGLSLYLKASSIRRILGLFTLIALVSALASYFYSFSWSHLEWQKLKFALEPQSRWPVEILKALSFQQILVLTLILGALVFLWRKRAQISESVFIPHVITTVLLQIILLTLTGFITERSLFLERYYVYLTPHFVFFLGSFLILVSESLKSAQLKLSFLVVCSMALTASALPSYYALAKSPWREVAAFIGQTPRPLVLTTRTLSIASPYYDLQSIPVQRLRPGHPEAIQQILAALETYERVWIVEIYFGSLTYWDSLKTELIQAQLQFQQRSFELAGAETIYTLEIKKQK